MIYHQYLVDDVLTPLATVLQLAGAGQLAVVSTSQQTATNGDLIVSIHLTKNPVVSSTMPSFYGNKSAEYKQRFNKKVVMA